MPITRKEFDAGKLFWWRRLFRVITLYKLRKRISDHILISRLRNDPEVLQAIKRSLQDYHEGKVIPWSEVKKELGLK